VPFQSTYTSFGTPAATRLVPPRIPRVRDIQFTTTFVVGWLTRSSKQRSIWPAGASMLPGMLPAWYSWRGRLSMSTQSSPLAMARSSSRGLMNVGRAWCATKSPKPLDGTSISGNSANPAAAQAGAPPASTATFTYPSRVRRWAATAESPSPPSVTMTRVSRRGTSPAISHSMCPRARWVASRG